MNSGAGNKKVAAAKEYEQRIPLLLSEHPEGFVHSVFQNGVNIRMSDRLFFIGTKKNGELPFGIHLSEDEVQSFVGVIEQESSVGWSVDSQELVFEEASLAVTLATATPFHWELACRELKAENVTNNLVMLLSILVQKPMKTGLDIDIEKFVADYLEGNIPASETGRQLKELVSVLLTSDQKKLEQTLRFFLGRGQGLTPSGDDHLVGILAIHTAVGLISPEALQTLRNLVVKENLTTDVGREYLLYALDGKFSSTVVKAASALTDKTDIYTLEPVIEDLLDMGHSSGIDTVFGMLLGLLIKRRKLEWLKK
ncbi:hypothetical protein NCCP2222_10270 [Sporosarcina sp. NCCP-2222]|uniref:DUF2877 domain-containing protein n=1 Tax=Sporosarcina sp. NCCP-2222 TaxID=2935073 RepID=UPI0020848E69|nr:DUF2877 domain-containing protein [Sporosarcina sp. NCCP-2222]GKV55080.1 hypothetical protein NCCP2222_10270 [Sporosarcina sp. NCCP-2222]